MDKPAQCPRCYRASIQETETLRYVDEEKQLRRWDNEGGNTAGHYQDQRKAMRQVLWTCSSCGWNKIGFSALEPLQGPEPQPLAQP